MNPRYIPHGAVLVFSALTFGFVAWNWSGGMTFPLSLFLMAKYSFVFAVLEIGLSLGGYYGADQKKVYAAMSRAITALGMMVSFVILISYYELGVLSR